mmetsp:Transcript_8981/g.6320  ORF Transcript_8981/g.6320 Transcript_8981/m.6320 type:complete len:87 (+) Transcript_8981:658-918(+)
MHKRNIVHRDLKPENIMCQLDDSFTVKLTDFGFASYIDPDKKTKLFCGSPLFIAPEIILGKRYDYKVDIWSIGVILYLLLSGKTPF